MKPIKFTLFIVVIQFSLFVASVYAQTVPPSKVCDSSFEVKLFKKVYLPLEPITVSYKIHNRSDSALQIGWAFTNHIYSLEVTKDNKKDIPQIFDHPGETGYTQIPPNQQFEKIDVLNFGLLNIFPKYGKYSLSFKISGGELGEQVGCEVTSNPIEITIQQPTGLNAEALDFIYKTQKSPIYRAFRGESEDKREDKTKNALEEFIEKYRDSVYGDYAVFYLALEHKRAGKYDLAKKEFNELKAKPDFGYQDDLNTFLSEIEQIENNQKYKKKWDALKKQQGEKKDND